MMRASPLYWFCLFAASALGTNLGDLWVRDVIGGRIGSFASLALIAVAGIGASRGRHRAAEAAFWLTIVVLRAAATNVGDFVTHDLRLGFVGPSLVLAAATLVAGSVTWPGPEGTPVVDLRYWVAMLLAGIVGTMAGDLASHILGLYGAALCLCLAMVLMVAVRSRLAPASVLAYWVVVLVERTAGTPVGDSLASAHAVGLGLPMATLCTTTMLLVGLCLRWRGKGAGA
jgi:uncharacterized membrane-anchored protein